MTSTTSFLLAVLCARHLPQLIFDAKNHGRARAYVKPTAIRAICIAAMYTAVLLVAIWRMVTDPRNEPSAFAIACIVAGAALGIAALWTLGRNYAEELVVFENAPLVVTGIYGVIRHPLRLGLSLEMIGLAAFADVPSLTVLIALTIGAQRIRSNEEAELLRTAFGSMADEYIEQVPAMNLPLGLLRSWRRGRTRRVPAGTTAGATR